MLGKSFVSYINTDAILQFVLGVCILVLSKITPISFGTILCIAFFIYGGYRAINAFILREYLYCYILDIILGITLVITGLILYMFQLFDISVLIAVFGLYFLLDSISSAAFTFQSKKIIYLWRLNCLSVIMQFLSGFVILLMLPTTALWFIGFLFGINFLISGFIKIIECLSVKFLY